MAAPVPMLTNATRRTGAPPTSNAYGRNNGGQPTDRIASYMYCEYTYATTDDSGSPVLIRCSDVAVIMPGYKRACAQHILHILADSLNSYLNREHPTAADAQLQAQYERDISTVTNTHKQLQKLLAPPKPRSTKAKTNADGTL